MSQHRALYDAILNSRRNIASRSTAFEETENHNPHCANCRRFGEGTFCFGGADANNGTVSCSFKAGASDALTVGLMV